MGVCVYFVNFLVIPIPINGIVFWLVEWLVLWCLMPLSTILLMEEIGGPGENRQSAACHLQTLSHNIVHIALSGSRAYNISGDRH
jgi:hypothetical protein